MGRHGLRRTPSGYPIEPGSALELARGNKTLEARVHRNRRLMNQDIQAMEQWAKAGCTANLGFESND